MNKKVITFLSLFSLIILMSIYYVVSPFSKDDLVKDVALVNNIDSYFYGLYVNREEEYNNYLNEVNLYLGSTNVTNEEKMQKIKEKDEVSDKLKKIKKIENRIKELGYEEVFIKDDGLNFYVLVKASLLKPNEVIVIIDLIVLNFENVKNVEVSAHS